jgi:hypothetical protein
MITRDLFNENYNGEYDDEAGMAKTNLVTIARAAQGLLDTIDDQENLPEWVQEKIAKVQGMMVTAWDYLESQEAQGIDPKITDEDADPNSGYAQLLKKRAELAARKKLQGVSEGDNGRDKHYYLRNDIWRVMDDDELVHEYTPERGEVVGAKKLLARFDDEGYDVTHVISPMGVVTYLYGKPEEDMDEGEKIGNMDADAYDSAMARLKQLAGSGPMQTVYDPATRRYKNVPTAVQPAQQPRKK